MYLKSLKLNRSFSTLVQTTNGAKVIAAPSFIKGNKHIGIYFENGSRFGSLKQAAVSKLFKSNIHQSKEFVSSVEFTILKDSQYPFLNVTANEQYVGFNSLEAGYDFNAFSKIALTPKINYSELDESVENQIDTNNLFVNDPFKYIVEIAKKTAFKNKGVGRPFNLAESSVIYNNIELNDVHDYFKKNIHPSRAILIGIGYTNEQLDNIANSLDFGDNYKTTTTTIEAEKECDVSTNHYTQFYDNSNNNSNFACLSLQTSGINSADYVKEYLLRTILGGPISGTLIKTNKTFVNKIGNGSTSRLAVNATKNSIESFGTQLTSFSHTGLLSLVASSSNTCASTLLSQLNNTFESLSSNPITEVELNKAKAQAKTTLLHNIDLPEFHIQYLLEHSSNPNLLNVENFVNLIDSVTLAQIQKFSKQFVSSSKPVQNTLTSI
eukprot:TRINITY_DN136_c0_g2_i1.p1 TRINITY_DN136_c0_g2~~TRINITY_DN136_c0_g2_i1.p1  ORF type:complete len:437 (-),score=168.92 TRINITY_DN136_c0_g2_i1:173-1483(-)